MDIKEYLINNIVSKTVIESLTGGGAGSILKIKFNNNCYFFIYCVWRIEHNDIVLATSDDDSQAIVGRMARSSKLLESKKIISFDLSKQYDLVIYFEDNFCFKTFSNVSYSQTENGGNYDLNWEFCLPDKNQCFEVTNHFKIREVTYND